MTRMTGHHMEISWKENEQPVRYFIHIKDIKGNCWKLKEWRRIIFDILLKAEFWVSPSCPEGTGWGGSTTSSLQAGWDGLPRHHLESLICVPKKMAPGKRTVDSYFRKPVRLQPSAKGLHPGRKYTPLPSVTGQICINPWTQMWTLPKRASCWGAECAGLRGWLSRAETERGWGQLAEGGTRPRSTEAQQRVSAEPTKMLWDNQLQIFDESFAKPPWNRASKWACVCSSFPSSLPMLWFQRGQKP